MTPTGRDSVGRSFLSSAPNEGAHGAAFRLTINRAVGYLCHLGLGNTRLSVGRIDRMDITSFRVRRPDRHRRIDYAAKPGLDEPALQDFRRPASCRLRFVFLASARCAQRGLRQPARWYSLSSQYREE